GILLTIHYETDLKGVQQGRYPFRSAVLNQFDLNCSSNLYKLVIAELAPQGPATLSSKRIHPAVTVIGSSTGGPRALTELLGSIGGPPHTPILIVQHIASQFSNNLVRDLTRTSPFPVREAVNHQAIERGVAYIAPGGYHMRVKRESGSPRIFLDTAPPINAVRPSVDCLFESAAEVYGAKVLGIILTGMGNDGAQGLKRIKEAGGIACVQDEKSCAVYGMPRAAIESKVVDYVLTLPQLAKVIREQATP
ncbi:MAG: chemotaxis protein CheB, partial [Chlamydiia bacterium]|nr:chemotaxis protein CheB [Chlamydiia bacterium]